MTSADRAYAFLVARPHLKAELEAKYTLDSIIEVFASLYDEAANETVRLERERCVAHLELGRACGDLGLAEKAILDGVSVASMHRKYIDTADQRGGLHAATVRHALAPEVRS